MKNLDDQLIESLQSNAFTSAELSGKIESRPGHSFCVMLSGLKMFYKYNDLLRHSVLTAKAELHIWLFEKKVNIFPKTEHNLKLICSSLKTKIWKASSEAKEGKKRRNEDMVLGQFSSTV